MESKLQSYINADLRKLKIGFWHREKGAYHKGRTHNKWKFDRKDKDEPEKSWPDLLIMPGNGRIFYVELKTKEGKESPEQIAFKQWSIAMGYHYYCVKNIGVWELVKNIEGLIA